MLKAILAYVLAALSMSLLTSVIGLALTPLVLVARRVKVIAPAATFLISTISMILALTVFVWVCGKIEIELTYLMFVLPYFLVVMNGWKRIAKAKKGRTIVETVAGEDYDPGLQIRMEYGYLVGDTVGWLAFLLYNGSLSIY